MKQINKNNSLEEILRDTKHNKKANEIILHLLAKQKVKANPFGVVRYETLPDNKIKPGDQLNDTV